MRNELILVINPGSTSTKVALFEGQKELSQRELRHDAAELKKFPHINDQREFREAAVLQYLKDEQVALIDLAAIATRGGVVGQLEPAEESVLRTYPLKLVYTDGDGRTYCVAVSRENVGCYGDGFEPRLLEDGGKAWRTMSRVMSDYLN